MNDGTLTLRKVNPPSPIRGLAATVHAATRAALDTGKLIDATYLAQEAGFRWPVCLTEAAWEACVEWTAEDAESSGAQTSEGDRLWQLLTYLAYYRQGALTCELNFSYFLIPRGATRREFWLTEIKAVIAPGLHGLPCLTVMLPSEY